jgi:hypothetical protein
MMRLKGIKYERNRKQRQDQLRNMREVVKRNERWRKPSHLHMMVREAGNKTDSSRNQM